MRPGVLCKGGVRGYPPGSARMPLLWAPWERELAAEAFTQGKTQEIGALGSWDLGSWGQSLWPGSSRYQRGGLVPAWCVSHLWIRVD